MLMIRSYRDDVLEHIDSTPEDVLAEAGYTRESLKADSEAIDKLWYDYQKSVTEYDCEPGWSWNNTLFEILGTRDLNAL